MPEKTYHKGSNTFVLMKLGYHTTNVEHPLEGTTIETQLRNSPANSNYNWTG